MTHILNSKKLIVYLVIILSILSILSIIYIILYIIRINCNISNNLPPVIIPQNEAFKILRNGIIDNNQVKHIITNTLNSIIHTRYIKEDKIPNIIHFIWIGSKIPEKYIKNINTYIENNPNYKIWLWHDNSTTNVKNVKIQLHNINEFKIINKYGFQNMKKWAGKADILRYEIIYNYGGMYIDVDSISLKPFDNTIFSKPFVCIETNGLFNNISNAQFGFAMNSKFLGFVIKCLEHNINYNMNEKHNLDDILSLCGPPFFTTCFYYWNSKDINCINQYYVILKNPHSYSYHTNDKNW